MGKIGLLCCLSNNKNGSISSLVRKRQWNIIHERLKVPTEQMRTEMMNIDDSGDTILHAVCRCNPPRELVQEIIAILPDTATTTNQVSQYALHIAAENGASPVIIRYLCNLQPVASGSRDNWGKTPLHLVCKNYAIKYKPYKDLSMTDAMLQAVRIIIDLSPETVNVDDEDGMTALEYAIEADADIRTIQSIQKACERSWKVKKSKSRSNNSLGGSPSIRRRTTRRNSFTKGPDAESLLALAEKETFDDNNSNSKTVQPLNVNSPQDKKVENTFVAESSPLPSSGGDDEPISKKTIKKEETEALINSGEDRASTTEEDDVQPQVNQKEEVEAVRVDSIKKDDATIGIVSEIEMENGSQSGDKQADDDTQTDLKDNDVDVVAD